MPGGLFCAIGNLLNDGTWTYTWQNGRQLKKMQKSGETVEFIYNENGLRVQKTATSTGVTKYTLHGKNIVHMTQGSNELHFFYDAQNKPVVVVYNGTPYTYVKNLQGDIVAILDSNGNKVVEYKYDAWGKPISKTGSMASTLGTVQPFRYRGYVYDEEIGLYYLRSRFYVPAKLRFLNADGLITNNLFKYCANNPISYEDHAGSEEKPVHDFTVILNQDLMEKEANVFAPLATNNESNKILSSINPMANGVELAELLYFAYSMMDGNMLSYKHKSVWDETFPDLAFIANDEKFIFRDVEISREDYGNISFGYLGRAAGYSQTFLLFGAGVYKQAKAVAKNQGISLFCAVVSKPHEILDRVFNLREDEDGKHLVLGNHLNDFIMICQGFGWYDQDHE